MSGRRSLLFPRRLSADTDGRDAMVIISSIEVANGFYVDDKHCACAAYKMKCTECDHGCKLPLFIALAYICSRSMVILILKDWFSKKVFSQKFCFCSLPSRSVLSEFHHSRVDGRRLRADVLVPRSHKVRSITLCHIAKVVLMETPI